MKVTIQDIAAEAGVSKSSVSLVLNGRECRIPEETQKRILDIANEKGYKLPKERNHKKDKMIGVIYQELDNFVHVQCMKGIEMQASIYGVNVLACNGGNTTDKTLEQIRLLHGIGVAGLILIPPIDMNSDNNNVRLGNALKGSGIGYLLLDQAIQNVFCDFVTSDNKAGANMATEHLLENGHRRIGLITGKTGVYTTRKRLAGYKEALAMHQIPFDEALVFNGNSRKEGGYQAAEYFHSIGVSAIFAMSDVMALGVYQYAQEHELLIGEDISIVGFDYSEECTDVTPALTSIRQEGEIMGKKACEMLVGRILGEEKNEPHRNNYFVPKLMERNSVKCILGLDE